MLGELHIHRWINKLILMVHQPSLIPIALFTRLQKKMKGTLKVPRNASAANFREINCIASSVLLTMRHD